MIQNAEMALTPQQQWRKKFPAVISGIFSFIQLILTIVIIGCEVGSILIDAVTATIYVGLWAGLFFLIACISQAMSSCCCRNCGCATYTLIMQIISVFFSFCVIGFDAFYIASPTTCFFPSSTCHSSGSARGVFYSEANFNNIKKPLIYGQLAAGCVMLLLCLVYILIYIITSIRVHRIKRSPNVHPQGNPPYPTLPVASNGMLSASPVNNYGQPVAPVNYGQPVAPVNYGQPAAPVNYGQGVTLIICPTCNTTMSMAAGKRPPM